MIATNRRTRNTTSAAPAAPTAEEVDADMALLQRIGQRDVAAFQFFYKKFSGLLYSTITAS